MNRRLSLIVLPRWLIAVPVVSLILYSVLAVIYLSAELLENNGMLDFEVITSVFLRQDLRAASCVTFAVLYGVLRACSFHPVFQEEYRWWLASTPWTYKLPLPLGPVHLVWQDLVFVIPATLIAWGSNVSLVLAIPVVFLTVYTVMITAGLFLTGERWIGFFIVFAMGFGALFTQVALMSGEPIWPTLAVIAAIYLLSRWGLHRSLVRFETWDENLADGYLYATFTGNLDWLNRLFMTFWLGWPFDSLPLNSIRQPLSVVGEKFVIGLLYGWWLYVAFVHIEKHVSISSTFLSLLLIAMFFSPLVLAIIFVVRCRPPITLWGRLRTGRWVIPGYDRCFLWPAAIWAMQWGLFRVAGEFNMSLVLHCAVQLTLFVWCMFRTKTVFAAFRLTGKYRMPFSLCQRMYPQFFTNA